jgi:hypothetical protein
MQGNEERKDVLTLLAEWKNDEGDIDEDVPGESEAHSIDVKRKSNCG